MSLRIVGAGLPRTGTTSLTRAVGELLGGRCFTMSEIPGHPFDLGEVWQQAFAGGTPEWHKEFAGYIGAVDWPTSAFLNEISTAYPDALVVLSSRTSAEEWWQSMNQTVLIPARMALAPDWNDRRDLVTLLERFTRTEQWDDPELLMAAYERHNADVRRTVAPERLVDMRMSDGWKPLCDALGLPIPDKPFPWLNKREHWG